MMMHITTRSYQGRMPALNSSLPDDEKALIRPAELLAQSNGNESGLNTCLNKSVLVTVSCEFC